MKTQIAKLNYLRMAPRKVRLVASFIKGLPVSEAEAQLLMSPKKAGVPLVKLLRSAISNAKNNQKLNQDKLFVKEIKVDGAPALKRFSPRAMGRATTIHKKGSHITIVLAESEKLKTPRFKIAVLKKQIAENTAKEKSDKERKKDAEKPKIKEGEKDIVRSAANKGFMKRMFRRKSV